MRPILQSWNIEIVNELWCGVGREVKHKNLISNKFDMGQIASSKYTVKLMDGTWDLFWC